MTTTPPRSQRVRITNVAIAVVAVGTLLLCACAVATSALSPKSTPTPEAVTTLAAGPTAADTATVAAIGVPMASPQPTEPATATPAPLEPTVTATSTPEPTVTAVPTGTSAPTATATAVPTGTPNATATPTPAPTPTPDMATTAAAFHAEVLPIFQAGEEADAYVQVIIGSEGSSLLDVYEAAKLAAETWEQVKFTFYTMRAATPDLDRAADEFGLAASYKEDAYRTLLRWTDTQRTSDLALYKEQTADAQSAMFRGLAIIGTLGGLPAQSATPTPEPAVTVVAPEPASRSGGLGQDSLAWEQAHARGPVEYGFTTYDDGAFLLQFTDDRVSYLELVFTKPHPDLTQALLRAATYIPADSVLVETYSPDGMPELVVYLYASEYLEQRFAADAFIQGEPGQFIAIVPVFDGAVPRVILALGNHP